MKKTTMAGIATAVLVVLGLGGYTLFPYLATDSAEAAGDDVDVAAEQLDTDAAEEAVGDAEEEVATADADVPNVEESAQCEVLQGDDGWPVLELATGKYILVCGDKRFATTKPCPGISDECPNPMTKSKDKSAG